MYQPLPDFAPLYPPGEWWRIYLNHLLNTREPTDGVGLIKQTNRDSGLKSREWMRFTATPPEAKIGTPKSIVLSLPVEGGASALKNRHPDSWKLASEGRRESRKIISTLETLYGRTPYFHLLSDQLLACFPAAQDKDFIEIHASLLCIEAFRKVEKVLRLDDNNLITELKDGLERNDTRLKTVAEETRRKLLSADPQNPSPSILDALFRIGPDAIFALLPTF